MWPWMCFDLGDWNKLLPVLMLLFELYEHILDPQPGLNICRIMLYYFTFLGMETLPRTTSHCGTLPYQRSSYGLSSAGLYVDSYRVSGEPVFSHRHSGLVDRVVTRTPSIESIHKDPRYWHTHWSSSSQCCCMCFRSGKPSSFTLNELYGAGSVHKGVVTSKQDLSTRMCGHINTILPTQYA